MGAQPVLPFERCVAWYLENPYLPLDKDDRALLERLKDDPRTNEVWSAVRAHLEQHNGPIGVDAPISFIRYILTLKKLAEEKSKADAAVPVRTAETKKLETNIRTNVVETVKKVPFDKLSEYLERAGKRLQGRPPLVMAARNRMDRDGSRARTYFMREVSDFMHEFTGERLDERVALITEIAFNTPDIISADSVRKARRQTG